MLLLAALLTAVLGACSASKDQTTQTQISKTIKAADGSVSIDVPDNWSEDATVVPERYLVLALTDGSSAFSQIFYYPNDESGYTAKDYCDMTAGDYYKDNVIGEVKETKINDHDAFHFEYSMVDEGVDGNEYNYHGYEYFIDFNGNVVEVDIFYSQSKLEGKLFTPSEEQLALLRSIAETARANA